MVAKVDRGRILFPQRNKENPNKKEKGCISVANYLICSFKLVLQFMKCLSYKHVIWISSQTQEDFIPDKDTENGLEMLLLFYNPLFIKSTVL